MARFVDESEDDLPDLADVITKHGNPLANGSKTRSVKSVVGMKDLEIKKMDSSTGHANQDRPKKLITEKKRSSAVKSQTRKRVVLNKACDNSLLRPLGKSQELSASSSFIKKGESRQTTMRESNRLGRKAERPLVLPVAAAAEEDDDDNLQDSTGLSDFIVSDSSFVDEEDSEYDIPLPQPPKSARKLVRGRRPERRMSMSSEHSPAVLCSPSESCENPLNSNRLDSLSSCSSGKFHQPKNSPQQAEFPKSYVQVTASSDMDEPFPMLSFSPSENKPKKVSKETRFATPPPSPQKSKGGLISPKKVNRIPLTPHRPSTDAFWSQDVVNDWNDDYSPRKALKPSEKSTVALYDDFSFDEPARSPRKLSTKQTKGALDAKKAFSQQKHELAASFLTELDQIITAGQVSEMAASTGGVNIIWSKTLKTTAGRANWRREATKSSQQDMNDPLPTITYRHYASIELAEKVIDDQDRLLNVIAHEFCHLANFMVSGIKNNPHGKEFKSWAAQCSRKFGDRGIKVTTKHSYSIDYKYVWECSSCGLEYKRHSKSVDPVRHRCGKCKDKLVQTKPAPRANITVNEYQLFVKENMKKVRDENPGSPQKDIMGLVGKKYQDFKASRLREGAESISVGEVITLDGSSDVDAVSRKLNFLDLTSS